MSVSALAQRCALWNRYTRENSATGTRTRVARVRAEYPNQLDYSGVEFDPNWILHPRPFADVSVRQCKHFSPGPFCGVEKCRNAAEEADDDEKNAAGQDEGTQPECETIKMNTVERRMSHESHV